MYKIVIHKRAAKYVQKLLSQEKEKVKSALREVSDNPSKHPKARRMLGEWKGYYRLHIGGLRVIFWVNKENKTMYVDYIGPRGDVYKS